MCPNMNNFDAVDFSECHCEEVISFLWRSVYKAFRKSHVMLRHEMLMLKLT